MGSGSYVHATLPVHTCGWVTVPRTVWVAASASNEVSRLTPTPSVFWAEKSLARTAPFTSACPAARTFSTVYIHACMHVVHRLQRRRRLPIGPARGSGSVFRPENVAIVERPDLASEAWPLVRFFSSSHLSLFLFLSPFTVPPLATLFFPFVWLCLFVHTNNPGVWDSAIIYASVILLAIFMLNWVNDNLRSLMLNARTTLLFISSNNLLSHVF